MAVQNKPGSRQPYLCRRLTRPCAQIMTAMQFFVQRINYVAMHKIIDYMMEVRGAGVAPVNHHRSPRRDSMATAKKTTEAFEFSEFEFTKYADSFREMAEKSMAQSKDMYDMFKTNAEDATLSAQKAFEALRKGTEQMTQKAMDNTKSNTEASLAFFEKLAGAKSVSEALEVQSEFFRKSFDALSAQAKEAQEMTMKLTEDTAAPVKEAAEKVVEKASKAA